MYLLRALLACHLPYELHNTRRLQFHCFICFPLSLGLEVLQVELPFLATCQFFPSKFKRSISSSRPHLYSASLTKTVTPTRGSAGQRGVTQRQTNAGRIQFCGTHCYYAKTTVLNRYTTLRLHLQGANRLLQPVRTRQFER